MPVTRPVDFLNWTDGSPTKVTQPGSSKKLQGWIVEEPPFQYINWLYYQTDIWIQWLDQLTQQLTVATGITALNNWLTSTGTGVNGDFNVTGIPSGDVSQLTEGMVISGGSGGLQSDTIITRISSATSVRISKALVANFTGAGITFVHRYATGNTIQKQLNFLDAFISVDPVAIVFPCDVTINQNSIIANVLADTNKIARGMNVSGTGIPANTRVLAISGTTITLTRNATATNSAQNISFTHQLTTSATVLGQLTNLDGELTYRTFAFANATLLNFASSPVNLDSSFSALLLEFDSTAGAITVNMPKSAFFPGAMFRFKDVGGKLSTNPVTLVPFLSSGDLLEGLNANYTLDANGGYWEWRPNSGGNGWDLV